MNGQRALAQAPSDQAGIDIESKKIQSITGDFIPTYGDSKGFTSDFPPDPRGTRGADIIKNRVDSDNSAAPTTNTRGSIESSKTKKAEQVQNSRGGLESSRNADSGSSDWQGGGSFGEADSGGGSTKSSGGVENDYGGGGGGGSDASNHSGQTTNVRHGSDSHTNNTHTSNQNSSNNSKLDNNRRATKGFFGKIFEKISNFFKGLTRGTSNKKDEPSVAQDSLFPTQNYSRTGDVDTDSESKNTDLVPYTTSAQTTQVNTIFSGKIMMKGKENNSDLKTKNRPLTNQLLVDYGCNQAIDFTKDFTTPNTPIRNGSSRIIPLSVRASNAPEGNHCFAFKIDTTNVVSEINEDNNQSDWKTFTVSSTVVPSVTSDICPRYQQPICGSGETVISGTVGSDGCQTAPSCVAVSSGEAGPDDIMFEVKSYVLSDPAANGTTARITVKDWSSDDITLDKYQKLAFRWSAYNYDSCLASIYPEKYIFDGNTTSITGNTENSGIAIKGLSRVYSIECTTGDVTYKKEINVQTQY